MAILEDLRLSVIEGDMRRAQELVRMAVADGQPAAAILKDGLVSAMAEVGRLFERGESFVPEMLIAARAMKAALALLRPQLVAAHVRPAGTVVIGTVQGDIHDIGKNLVGMMLEGAGFEVVDLGTDVPTEKYVQAARERHPDLVACSALLTTTMPRMKDVVNGLREAGLRAETKVMIGGAPITDEYAREVGADLYAPDAASAAACARRLISERKGP